MRYWIKMFLLPVFALLYVGAGTRNVELTEGIQPGNLAPELELQGVDLTGNGYVVVQFWAAYDPASRAENTRMYNLISQSETANVRLVSISLDENPAVFKGIVKADHLDESTQWNEPDGKNSVVFKQYRLKAGFKNWLVNSEGVIVAKNVSPTEILEKIAL